MLKRTLLIGSLCLSLAFKAEFKDPWESSLVTVMQDGQLKYNADGKGNTIPDFSHVGYHHGEIEIPDVRIVKSVNAAATGSSDEIIQHAINEVAKMPLDKNGFRGAILLRKGQYVIADAIKINQSGIVLRGEGDAAMGTRLIAAGKGQRALVQISGTGSLAEIAGSRVKITDKYVPVGATSFTVSSASQFKVGDEIVLLRPGTTEWIKDIQMDRIEARQGTKQWQPGEYDLRFERKITAIDGNKIMIDNPVMMQMEEKYGGGQIYKSSFKGRITEVGIENMFFESAYTNDTDEDHSWIAVKFDKVENGWARNLTSKYFAYSCVSLENGAKNITVKDSKCFDAKSIITGGRRYSFNNDGQQNLFMNLETTEGRHDYVTGARTLGPNVFYNCKASSTHADIGPHHRWAAGTLYDNIITDGEINIQDRGNWGSGHGWAGVTQVLWNCKVKRAAVQSPWASGLNYSIGTQGEKSDGRFSGRPDGVWENQNKAGLNPESLYMAQLRSRKK
ncbi:hypothetical protein [Desertivirga arenae]|uniref:hypothetical protein n=1 Tax=Desertivirga arenae TaxID=2810309 RepID=UPI001F601C5A|nr:hypothetical protein [Pedobacter sp. SYSU D00823]